MDNAKTDRLEQLIVMSARHLPHRADVREREWLARFDECPTPGAQVSFTLECLAMASGGLLRGTLLKLARAFFILTVAALPTIWDKIAADWTVLPALGIFMLMLLPSLQRQTFDAHWYPYLTWSTWIWRSSAAAWLLLLLSALFVAHDYAFAVGFAGVMVIMYGWDAERLMRQPTTR